MRSVGNANLGELLAKATVLGAITTRVQVALEALT